jgi:hypothetical protein
LIHPFVNMPSYSAIIIGFAAVAALIQPTPAPPLVIVSTLAAGAIAAGAAVSGVNTATMEGLIPSKRSAGAQAGMSVFQQCLDDSARNTVPPTLAFTGPNAFTIYGASQSCYDAVNEYQKYNDGALDAILGTASVQGGNSIVLNQVPNSAMQDAYTVWGQIKAAGIATAPIPASPPASSSSSSTSGEWTHWSRRSY